MTTAPQDSHTGTRHDAKRDEALKESFPASDPPSTTPPPGSRKAEKEEAIENAAGDAEPKGHPTSDRHASEVASGPANSPPAAHRKAT